MYFRFGSALVLVILVCVAGVAIEKQCLALKRAVVRQQYRRDALADEYARLRLETQRLGAPARLFETLENAQGQRTPTVKPRQPASEADSRSGETDR
jgi:cell division protein FtsL